MYPINLYLLSKTKPLKIEEFINYYSRISKTDQKLNIRDYERDGLYKLVDGILKEKDIKKYLDGYFYSYSIEQISKEFDLIKIFDSYILNIEIKSEEKPVEEIKKQLLSNKHYLKSIKDTIVNFTYISDTKKLFMLNNDEELVESNFEELVRYVVNDEAYYKMEIENLFTPSKYLVSPFNDINKFIDNKYFLTEQQYEIKKSILDIGDHKFYKILGNAGTGKTLLIYDIAKEVYNIINVCIIHCGILNEGHRNLMRKFKGLNIIPIKELEFTDLSIYDLVIIDEAQRMYEQEFYDLIDEVSALHTKIIFSIGVDQIMQENEVRANINSKINELQDLMKFELTNKIRTNKNIVAFIKNVLNLNNKDLKSNYQNVDIFYCLTKAEGIDLLKYLHSVGYVYISFTTSLYVKHDIDEYISELNTHEVIGQEFDNVVMIMGSNFQYIDDNLHSDEHPNPNYIFKKLFYQGVTRAREKLAIVVIRNPDLYKKLIEIKNNQ